MLSVKADLADHLLALGQLKAQEQVQEIQSRVHAPSPTVENLEAANPWQEKARNRSSKCWVAQVVEYQNELRYSKALLRILVPVSGHGVSLELATTATNMPEQRPLLTYRTFH